MYDLKDFHIKSNKIGKFSSSLVKLKQQFELYLQRKFQIDAANIMKITYYN